MKTHDIEYDARVMTEPTHWAPWKTAASMAIGAVLGSSVYVAAEARHSTQQAEHAALMPPTAAAAERVSPPGPARDDHKDTTPAPEAAPQPTAAEPAADDPKARALAARSAAERSLLDEARSQLEAKNLSAAQAALDQMKKRFARGALVQERELLRIEVYKARGQLAAAKRAARKFAKAYPDSPHLDELVL